jgi:hypothetical protein
MEKQTTKIIVDKKQTRTTIPKKFVDDLEIKSIDEMKWVKKNGKLKGELIKNE